MSDQKIIKCINCGKAYYIFMHTVKDQSVCPRCRDKMEKEADQQYTNCTNNEALKVLWREAIDALEYVAIANYPEREREAKTQLAKAFQNYEKLIK